MKKTLISLFIFIVFSVNIFAQDTPNVTTFFENNGYTGIINSVAFSPDGKTLASGSDDGTICLWDVDTGALKRTLTGHIRTVLSVAFSPDGSTLASGGGDNTIRLWDVGTRESIHTLTDTEHTKGFTSVSFSPDGQTLASGSADGTIRLWELETRQHIRTLTGRSSVNSVVFHPNGKILASGGKYKGSGTIMLWDVSTGIRKKTLYHGHDWRSVVNSIAFSPDGNTLASGNRDNTIKLWDIGAAVILWDDFNEITIHGQTLKGHPNVVSSVVFSPDGKTLVSGGSDDIYLWNVSTGASRKINLFRSSVNSVAFSPDGKTLAAGGGNGYDGSELLLFDRLGSIGSINHIRAGSGTVNSVVFSPDGKTLANGNWHRTVTLWDVTNGTREQTLIGHKESVNSVAFSPDGQILASGSDDKTIRLWDVHTGTLLRTLTEHTDEVTSVAFSPYGYMLASGSRDNTIRLWDVHTGTLLKTLTRHTGGVTSVVFSPDGRTLASGIRNSLRDYNIICLWNVNTGTLLRTLTIRDLDEVTSVSFSPDGRTLASGDYWSHSEDLSGGDIYIWDVNTGTLLRTLRRHIDGFAFSISAHTDGVTSVVFSPDGYALASGSRDDTIRLWDVNTGTLLRTLTGHTSGVTSVVFSPDGYTLASGSYDNTIRLWELELPVSRVSITPYTVVSPAIGEQFTINVSIVAGENVGGYQVSLVFDPIALRYVESANGDYLPSGAFFVPPVVSSVVKDHNGDYIPPPSWYPPEDRVEKAVTLGATSVAGVSDGDGTLATVTFEVLDVKESVIGLFGVILTDSDGEHLPQLSHSPTKVVEPSLLPSSAIISLTPSSVLSPAIGEQLTFNIDITSGQNVKDFQLTLDFDQSALEHISISPGNYLANGVGNGDGTLETVTFEVLAVKALTISLSGHLIATNGLLYAPTFESAEVIVPLFGDVNRDGVVNILDLVQVASKFGQRVSGDPADVNEDGVVNIVDLVKVAGALGGDAAAPPAWSLDLESTFTREQVQKWLSEAEQVNLTDATAQRGILFLEQLLAALTPKETRLLANYPNPFNPETWIPYQLAAPADVTLTIYAVDGTVVRQLALGYQSIGIYQGKSRAAYWDGKNALGEPMASGIYFYTLTAGDFSATRKMLIKK